MCLSAKSPQQPQQLHQLQQLQKISYLQRQGQLNHKVNELTKCETKTLSKLKILYIDTCAGDGIIPFTAEEICEVILLPTFREIQPLPKHMSFLKSSGWSHFLVDNVNLRNSNLSI